MSPTARNPHLPTSETCPEVSAGRTESQRNSQQDKDRSKCCPEGKADFFLASPGGEEGGTCVVNQDAFLFGGGEEEEDIAVYYTLYGHDC